MNQAEFHHARAVAAFERQDLKAALRHAGKAAQRGGAAAVHWCVLASLQEKVGAFPAAIRSLGEAISRLAERGSSACASASCGCRAPEPVYVFMQRAHLLWREGELDAAVEDFEAALAHKPTADVHCHVGVLRSELGAMREARAAFLRALRLEPHYPGALLGLAGLSLPEDPARAERYVRRLLRRHPGDPFALRTLGLILLMERRDEEAEVALREAAATADGDEVPALLLARLLIERGDLDEAERWLDVATGLAPLQPTVVVAQGDLALRRGRDAAAEEAYRTALRLEPDAPEAALHLGGLLLEQGRAEEASTLLRIALDGTPEAEPARRIRGLLARAHAEVRLPDAS